MSTGENLNCQISYIPCSCERMCDCCSCLDPIQLIGNRLEYPLSLLYALPSPPLRYFAAWVTKKSPGNPSVHTEHGLFLSMEEANAKLEVRQSWFIKLHVNGSEVLLPLACLHNISWTYQRERSRVGTLSACRSGRRVTSPEDILLSNPHLRHTISTELDFSESENIRASKRKRSETTAISNKSRLCAWMPRQRPVQEWTQARMATYFKMDDRKVDDDPCLSKINAIQYHSFGLPLYECEWTHPCGEKICTVHRCGDLQPNEHYLHLMAKFELENPDDNSWDTFE